MSTGTTPSTDPQTPRHRNEDWLRQKYWNEEMAMSEVAKAAGVDTSTVHKWMDRLGIERRDLATANSIAHGGKHKRYRDEEWLREKYTKEGLSTVEIGDLCGVDDSTIYNWMVRFGIETRSLEGRDNYAWTEYCGYTVTEGRPVWHIGRHSDYNGQWYPIHRLLAISEFGADAVVGKEVHHKNGIPWDNRPDNLEVLDPVAHSRRHGEATNTAETPVPEERECDLCGKMVDLEKAIPDKREEPVHRHCYVDAYGGPVWLE